MTHFASSSQVSGLATTSEWPTLLRCLIRLSMVPATEMQAFVVRRHTSKTATAPVTTVLREMQFAANCRPTRDSVVNDHNVLLAYGDCMATHDRY